MPNLKHPARQDQDVALMAIHIEEKRQEDTANGFHYPPPTLWQTFEKHLLLIIGGSLVGAAILYGFALVRGW